MTPPPVTESLTDISPSDEQAASEDTGLLGDSPAMRAVAARLAKVASSDLPVLIRGETGTGKELAARALHELSARRLGPFVSENCAALAEGVLEAELFGHEKGAYTGAEGAREGLFERAHGGTLFIDEVGDMSPGMQGKVLRALQEHEVRRVGGGELKRVNVRVIAATHRDLDDLVKKGLFRADLLYRLHVLEVVLPPLRERLADIPILADTFLKKVQPELASKRPLVLSEAALDALLAHDWPGNVRELENAVRVGAIFSPGPFLEEAALPIPTAKPSLALASQGAALRANGPGDENLTYDELRSALEARERRYIAAVLKETASKSIAAKKLGMTRYALYRIMKRLAIPDSIEPEQMSESDEAALVAHSSGSGGSPESV